MKTRSSSIATSRRASAAWAFLALLLLAASLPGPCAASNAAAAPAAREAEAPAATCPFCLGGIRPKDDFCARCGRLARLTGTAAEHRFWGDAVYVEFTRFDDRPKLDAKLDADGLVSELVSFSSGDRVEMSKRKKDFLIEGKLGSTEVRKEDSYKATMSETRDGEARLIQRSVWAKRNADPDTYLYRVIDYRYTSESLLDRIKFDTKIYLGESDWKKRPAAWTRYSGGEIVMVREAGTLRAIETKVRIYKRSLRGEPELGEEKTLRENVLRVGDLVDAVVPEDAPAR